MKDFDPVSGPDPVPSPCIDICKMNPATSWCEGCLRSIDEISMWSTASNDAKRAVWVEIRRRQDALFDS